MFFCERWADEVVDYELVMDRRGQVPAETSGSGESGVQAAQID